MVVGTVRFFRVRYGTERYCTVCCYGMVEYSVPWSTGIRFLMVVSYCLFCALVGHSLAYSLGTNSCSGLNTSTFSVFLQMISHAAVVSLAVALYMCFLQEVPNQKYRPFENTTCVMPSTTFHVQFFGIWPFILFSPTSLSSHCW